MLRDRMPGRPLMLLGRNEMGWYCRNLKSLP
jgi:hypothetical protein